MDLRSVPVFFLTATVISALVFSAAAIILSLHSRNNRLKIHRDSLRSGTEKPYAMFDLTFIGFSSIFRDGLPPLCDLHRFRSSRFADALVFRTYAPEKVPYSPSARARLP
jgi:hypothetical protein